jgi:hypothetical protein
MAPRPFITGSREIESHTYDKTVTMTAGGGQPYDTYDFVTDGYVAGCYIYVTADVSANDTNSVAFNEDGPWNALLNVQFSDVSNRPIIGPMSGWELKECIKYGGYTNSADPINSTLYSAVTGTGSTGGTFSFMLHLPIEFVHRNAMGSLTNLSNAAVFRLDMTLNGSTAIYSTAPSVLPNVRVRLQQHGWMESAGRDPFGNPASPTPPAVDTVQYWERQTYTLASAAQNFRFTPFEGHVRNVIFVLRGATPATARADGQTDWPDPLRLHYDATIPVDRLKPVWQRYVEELWGYSAALGSNPVNGKENGVFPLAFDRDFANAPGAEQGYGYLYVSAGTAIRFDGTIGGSGTHTLTVLWNYINPAGGNPLALTGGK